RAAYTKWPALMLVVCCICTDVVFFFFQAEDGIRDDLVTGVQTCALPISIAVGFRKSKGVPARSLSSPVGISPESTGVNLSASIRSEERRVGKECRSRRSRYDEKKKKRSNKESDVGDMMTRAVAQHDKADA